MSANLLTTLSYKNTTNKKSDLYLSYNYTTMANSRKLKIHKKYQSRTYGGTTIPEIRLEGKWLGKLGFKEGQIIKIEEKKNKLTITIDKGSNNLDRLHTP